MKRGKLSQDVVDSDSDYDSSEPSASQQNDNSKTTTSSKSVTNSDESYFELSGKRRVTVRKFRSSVLIDVREYYEDKASGEEKPGKKGISLTIDQYEKLKELLPEIDAAIKNMNQNE